MLLAPDDLIALTGRMRAAAQRRALDRMGEGDGARATPALTDYP